MELTNIVLHQVIKNQNTTASLNCSNHLLDNSEPTVLEFMEKLIKNFKLRSPTLGQFQADKENFPFQEKVSQYQSDNDFLKFTKESMGILKKEIDIPQTVGGYVVFCHYKQKNEDFLVIMMLDKSPQFTVDDTSLDIKKLQTLDIEKLARASRLNISKWNDNKELYLAFIKGTKAVSNYFQRFIGNTDLTSAKVNAKNLKKALSKFMRVNNYADDKIDHIYYDIKRYMDGRYANEEDVELDAVSAIVSPDEDPVAFKNFIHREDMDVSGSFRLNKKDDYRNMYRSVVKERGYRLEFDRALITQGKIVRDGKNIVISDVNEKTLNEEFGTQEQNEG